MAEGPKIRTPTADWPTLQKLLGRPTISSDHQGTQYTLVNSDNYVFLGQSREKVPKYMSFNMDDKKKTKSVLEFTRMFNTNKTAPPFDDAAQIVAAIDYTWEVKGVEKETKDDKSTMGTFSTVAVPISTGVDKVRPTFQFRADFMSNENITETRLVMQVDQYNPAWWKGWSNVVFQFNLTMLDAKSNYAAPGILKQKVLPTSMHVKPPVQGGFGGGAEFKDAIQQVVVAGGQTIYTNDFAFEASGNKKAAKVYVTTKSDKFNSTILYVQYAKFETSLITTTYVALNENSLGNPGFSLRPLPLVAALSTLVFFALTIYY